MTEHHIVDAGDQRIEAEGVEDHSYLTTAYVQVEQKDLGPWMQENERQAALQADQDAIVKGLRKSVVPLGLLIALPVILGILIGQIVLNIGIDQRSPSAMAYVIGMIFGAGISIAITIASYKWVGRTFHNHTIRGLPIMCTVIGSLIFLFDKVFQYTNVTIGGVYGYGTALITLLIISIIITTIGVFAWTAPKLPAVLKLLVLLLLFGGSVALFYLA